MGCITTYTHKSVDPLRPKSDCLDVCDIAHALSLLCRAGGHFPHFYSVAQHCLNCAAEAKACGESEKIQLACLLHDASEAYLVDLPRPLKEQLPDYVEAENTLLSMIMDKWLPDPLTEAERRRVFEIDDAMLAEEFRQLMNKTVSAAKPIRTPDLREYTPCEIEEKYLHTMRSYLGISEPVFVGVDGCENRWAAAELRGTRMEIRLFDDLEAICAAYADCRSILIDIPIGLPSTAEQSLCRPDREARAYLKNGKLKSSVFPVPVRQAIYAESYHAANTANVALTGKKLSMQSYAICGKIRGADGFLQTHPQWKNRLTESHPELAFQVLNHGNAVLFSKHTKEGIAERTEILSAYIDNLSTVLARFSVKLHEDILDAAALAVTAKRGTENGFRSLPEHPVQDANGLWMRILLCKQ